MVSTPAPDSGAAHEGRSARKRRTIVAAARELFLREGFVGASVDGIAALAGVSKQTVYKHFGDKERLFTEVAYDTVDAVGQPFFAQIDSLEDSQDVEADIRELAGRLIGIVANKELLQLRRLVIGQAARFPELGRRYYERSVGRTAQSLVGRFERLAERGSLRLEDPQLAAEIFIWLVLSIPLNRAMLTAQDQFDDVELDRCVQEAVRVFLAAYGPHQTP